MKSNEPRTSIARSALSRTVLAMFVALATLGGTAVVSTSPAQATAWDPHVILNGRVGCTYSTSNAVKWMYVKSSNGEQGWASLSGSGMTRQYTFNFYKAPTTTMKVTVSWGCSIDGNHSTSFGVNRPSTGVYTTRNICYWSPCWI